MSEPTSTPETETTDAPQAPAVTLPPLPQHQTASAAINTPVLQQAAAVAPPLNLSRAIFDDETPANAYTSSVPWEAYTLYIDEMTGAQYKEYEDFEMDFLRQARAMQNDNAMTPEQGKELGDRMATEQMQMCRKIVEKHVVGWTIPRVCSHENKAKMSGSAVKEICKIVVSQSRLGKAESDFSRGR